MGCRSDVPSWLFQEICSPIVAQEGEVAQRFGWYRPALQGVGSPYFGVDRRAITGVGVEKSRWFPSLHGFDSAP